MRSEDEFEAEAARDAIDYAAAQAIEADRTRTRLENKRKRQQGLPTQPVPRRMKAHTKPEVKGSDTSGSQDSDDSRQEATAHKKKQKFRYEGRKFSPHGTPLAASG